MVYLYKVTSEVEADPSEDRIIFHSSYDGIFQETSDLFASQDVVAINLNGVSLSIKKHEQIKEFTSAVHPGIPVVAYYNQDGYTNTLEFIVEHISKEIVSLQRAGCTYSEIFGGFIYQGIRYERNYWRRFCDIQPHQFAPEDRSQVMIHGRIGVNTEAVEIIVKIINEIMAEKGVTPDQIAYHFSPLLRLPDRALSFRPTPYSFIFGCMDLVAVHHRTRQDELIPLAIQAQRTIYNDLNLVRTNMKRGDDNKLRIAGYRENQVLFKVGEEGRAWTRFMFGPHLGRLRQKDLGWLKELFTQAVDASILANELKEDVNKFSFKQDSMLLIYDIDKDNLAEIKPYVLPALEFLKITSNEASCQGEFVIDASNNDRVCKKFVASVYQCANVIHDIGLREEDDTTTPFSIGNWLVDQYTFYEGKMAKVKIKSQFHWLVPYTEIREMDMSELHNLVITGTHLSPTIVDLITRYPILFKQYDEVRLSHLSTVLTSDGRVRSREALIPGEGVLCFMPPTFGLVHETDPGEPPTRALIPPSELPYDISRLLLESTTNALLGYRIFNEGGHEGDVLFISSGSSEILTSFPRIIQALGKSDSSAMLRYRMSYPVLYAKTLSENGGALGRVRLNTEIAPHVRSLSQRLITEMDSITTSDQMNERTRLFDQAIKACGDNWQLIRYEGKIYLRLFLRNIWLDTDGNTDEDYYYLGNYIFDIDLSRDNDYPYCYGGVYQDDEYCHPHVNRSVCLGNARIPYLTAINQRNLFNLHAVARSLLETYNDESPYIRLDEFVFGSCCDCHTDGNVRWWGGNYYCSDCYKGPIEPVQWDKLPRQMRLSFEGISNE